MTGCRHRLLSTSRHPVIPSFRRLGGCAMRFDEIEFESVPFDITSTTEPASDTDAPRLKRLAALIIDLSLFAALALALSPLLPASRNPWSIAALAGFVVVVSYY